jgi:beta-lactamase regulating signal transducer with metallopeptidase domain
MAEAIVYCLAAWLLTYAIHSTVLLTGVWMIARFAGKRFAAMEESAWRAALFGSVFTAAVQTLLLVRHPAVLLTGAAASMPTPLPVSVRTVASTGTSLVVQGMMVLWVIIAGLRAGTLIVMLHALHERVRAHARLAAFSVARRAAHFAGNARVTVIVSPAIATPLVLGGGQLCLPERTAHELSDTELDAILAHEVAHVVRRDPSWMFAAELMRRVFFFQPLNAVATARLRAIAECSCDDWALSRTGDGIALASALARATSWVRAGEQLPLAVAMTSTESLALIRVRRILDPTLDHRPQRSHLGVASVLAMVATIVLVPGISAAGAIPRPYTIHAIDDAGAFTVTLDRGVVTSMTIAGEALPHDVIEQNGTHVHAVDQLGRQLDFTLTPAGGMRWRSRAMRDEATH